MLKAEIDESIRQVLEEARNQAGSAAALSAELQRAGIAPETGGYSPSAVSNWIRGRVRPPADVVLAAARLFDIPLWGRHSGDSPGKSVEADEVPVDHQLKDVIGAFSSRSESQVRLPFLQMLTSARCADLMGLSLNSLCQGIADHTVVELVEAGLSLRCLFLAPDSDHTHQREQEESLPQGHLSNLTNGNMERLRRIQSHLSPEARNRLLIKTYSSTLRFNLTILDNHLALVQLYLSSARGLSSPSFLLESSFNEPHGLFPIIRSEFDNTWEHARNG